MGETLMNDLVFPTMGSDLPTLGVPFEKAK